MIVGHKYRIYPTVEQEQKLAQVFGVSRFVYNWGLSLRSEAYKEGRRCNYAESSREFTKLRNSGEFPWLKDVQSNVAANPLRNLQSAFSAFFQKKRKYPKFKKKTGSQSAYYREDYFKFVNGRLRIARLGELKIIWTRDLPSKPKAVTISKASSGKYYASFLVEKSEITPKGDKPVIGIDLGVKHLAILSNGRKYAQFDSGLDKKLALEQRRLARKQKGSNRRAKQRVKVARVYEKIANRRDDHLHKVTTSLVRDYSSLVLEDLNAKGLVKNHNLARSISNASFGQFKRMLEYKAKLYGRKLTIINRFEPTSKMCSECGKINTNLTLADREWTCPCGAVHDRDVNAARNILAAGIAVTARGEV